MRPSDINADRWAGGILASGCTVDGQVVDPWTVQAASAATGSPSHDLVLRVAAEVMCFELGQSGIKLTNVNTLVDFVRDDLLKQGMAARSGYLDFIRAILKPRERDGFFRRLFMAKPKVPSIAWLWVSEEDVELEDEAVVIRGKVMRMDR